MPPLPTRGRHAARAAGFVAAPDRGLGLRRARWVALIVLCFLWARPAHAYIDAGTGGLLVQLLVAGIAGAGVILKMYWQKLAERFGRREK